MATEMVTAKRTQVVTQMVTQTVIQTVTQMVTQIVTQVVTEIDTQMVTQMVSQIVKLLRTSQNLAEPPRPTLIGAYSCFSYHAFFRSDIAPSIKATTVHARWHANQSSIMMPSRTRSGRQRLHL